MSNESSIEKKAIKATIWSIVCAFITKGVSFITLPIFTRMLTTDQYGMVSTYLSWYAILSLIIPLNVSNSMSKAYYEFKDEIYKYMSSILFMSMSSVCIVGVVFYILQNRIGVVILDYPPIILVGMFMAMLVCEGTSCYVWLNRYSLNYKITSTISLWNLLADAGLSIFFIFLFPFDRGVSRIIGSFTPIILLGTYLSIKIYRRGKTLINLKYWKFAFLYAVSGIMYSLSGQILAQSDKLMIRHSWGDTAVALYSVPHNVGTLLITFWNCILMGFTPWMFEKLENHQYENIRGIVKKISNVGVLAALWVVALGPVIINILAGEVYLEAKNIIPPFIVGVYISCVVGFQLNIENYNKKPHYAVVCMAVAAIINIILNLLLLRSFGYTAAAYTSEVGYIIMFILHVFLCKKITRDNIIPTRKIVCNIVALIVGSEILAHFYNSILFVTIAIGVMSILWFILNVKDIRFYIKLIKTRKFE